MLGFRNVADPKRPGSYYVDGNEVILTTRPFQFWDEKTKSSVIKIKFESNAVSDVYNFSEDKHVDVMRMEPVIIGGIYPSHKEDRLLVKFNNVPDLLKSTLLLVEDGELYNHHGLYYNGIGGVFWG